MCVLKFLYRFKEIRSLQKQLQLTREQCDYYTQLCNDYQDISHKVQFKEWDINNCQYYIDKYKRETSSVDEVTLWTSKISEYEARKEFYIAELKLLQGQLTAKKNEYHLDREVLYELTTQRQQLQERM